MVKQREPGGLSEALFEIGARLTIPVASDITGKSTAAYYKWTDPDEDMQPNIRQCLALDKACMEEGGNPAIFDWYRREIEKVGRRSVEVDLMDAILDVNASIGRLAEQIKQAKAPTSEGGERITIREKRQILPHLVQLQKTVNSMVDSLQPNIKEVSNG